MGTSVTPQTDPNLQQLVAGLLARGTDEATIAKAIQEYHAPQPSVSSSVGPVQGTVDVIGNVLRGLGQTVRHPIDTALQIAQQTGSSLKDALFSPVVGEQPDPLTLARVGPLPGFTGPATAAQGAISPQRFQQAGLQTVANAATLIPGGGIPGVLAKGAGVGAAYNPEHPIEGAASGALLAATIAGAAKGVGATVSKIAGGKTPSAADYLQNANVATRAPALRAETQAFANPAYDALRANPEPYSVKSIDDVLNNPKLRPAWNTIQNEADLSPNRPADRLIQRFASQGYSQAEAESLARQFEKTFPQEVPQEQVNPESRVIGKGSAIQATTEGPTFDQLHQFQRLLNDRAKGAWEKGNGTLAQAYGEIRNAVLDIVGNRHPEYRAINAEYATRMDLEDALRQGEADAKNPNLDPRAQWKAFDDRVEKMLARDALSFEQKSVFKQRMNQEYQTGIASALLGRLMDKYKTGVDLQLALGRPAQADALIQKALNKSNLKDLAKKAGTPYPSISPRYMAEKLGIMGLKNLQNRSYLGPLPNGPSGPGFALPPSLVALLGGQIGSPQP